MWLRDTRTGHDLALSVKKSRRPGFSNGCSTTTSRINVMNFHSGAQLSTTSNSSSYLPVLHPQLSGYAAAHHSAELHTNSARLAVAAGMRSGSLDPYSMLQNSNVMRLLPLQQGNPALMGPAAAAMLQGSAQNSGYMAHDVCEAMLDYCDSAGLNMGMPVHLQPAMAAQVGQTGVEATVCVCVSLLVSCALELLGARPCSWFAVHLCCLVRGNCLCVWAHRHLAAHRGAAGACDFWVAATAYLWPTDDWG